METIIEILERLFSKTPKFFRVIRNVALSVVATATLVLTLQAQGVELPNWLKLVFEWEALIGGAVISFVAQLTKIWTDDDGVPLNDLPQPTQNDLGGSNPPKDKDQK